MEIIRFKLAYTIKRKDFYECQKLDNFRSRMYYNKIRKQLFINSVDEVNRLRNKNFIIKWWNNYKKLKNLTENFTYLDIDVEFWENSRDSLIRALTGLTINNMKKEGLI